MSWQGLKEYNPEVRMTVSKTVDMGSIPIIPVTGVNVCVAKCLHTSSLLLPTYFSHNKKGALI